MTAPRVGIYVRISEDDGSALGVERQERDCRDLAERNGWEVASVYSDNDVSATRARVRPQYQRMLADVRAGQIAAIVVWDVDRLTRTPRELEDVIDLADRHGLKLASVGGEIDLGTAQGRLTARLKGSVARHEVEQSSRRLKRKFDELAAAGHPTGKPAFGYTRTHETRNGHRVAVDVVNPAEAAVVREAVRRTLAGEGLWKIAKDFNARGITTNTGGPWQTQPLRNMLLRPRYAGLRVHRGKVVGPAAWEPIIDRETHERLVAKLTDPARRTSNRGTEPKYLLSNIALCGKCGGRLVGTAEFAYTYRSFPHRLVCNNPGCHGVSRKMADIDEVVNAVLVGRLERDGLDLLGGDAREAADARQRIDALESKLAITADQFAADVITSDQMARITGRIRPQLDAERARLARSEPQEERARFAGPGAREAWESADIDVRRAIVADLMTVTVLPSGPGRRFEPELVRIEWKANHG